MTRQKSTPPSLRLSVAPSIREDLTALSFNSSAALDVPLLEKPLENQPYFVLYCRKSSCKPPLILHLTSDSRFSGK